ncbi:MAG TPA: TIM-barrel domain-containing protein, partial [Vicinamibacterales bacterium]|nr:TIM-barrel domain-containing protein [Vicinamibacterales bacterium]
MITRRQLIKTLGATAAAPIVIRGQRSPITVAGRPVEIVVTPISASTVRISVRPIVDGSPQPIINRGALVAAAEQGATAGDLMVRVVEGSRTTVTITRGARQVQQLVFNSVEPAVSMASSQSPILGLGEGGPQFDRRGSQYSARSGQGGYQLRTHGGRVPIQWLVGTEGWGVYIHQPIGAFDLVGGGVTFTPSNDALPFDAFIVGSDDPRTIIGEYARITGYAELPPLWSFGYMQSHRTLAGPDEIYWVARTFREKRLPCDALIYLGTEFTPSGWNTRNGEFGWKPDNFPAPQQFVNDMHAQHYKVVLHVVIEGQRMSGAVADPCTPDQAVPSGRTSDDRWPADRAVPCYWPYHKPLYDLGVDGMWPDQGDGLDEPSRLARIRMYWEGPQQYRPDERPFALHRNGAPGMQRYAAFLWSGDV